MNLTFSSTPPYNVIHTDCFSQTDIQNAKALSNACSLFYNQGRAVPWFNTLCNALRMRPSDFFKRFAKEYNTEKNNFQDLCMNHKAIEKLQLEFVSKLYKEKNLNKLYQATADIIRFNGAMSRVLDTGTPETITLSYAADYIDSPYATDIPYFAQNIPRKNSTINLKKKNNYVTW